eukprot:ANDGO_01934.mRNA.1 hypothetical protein
MEIRQRSTVVIASPAADPSSSRTIAERSGSSNSTSSEESGVHRRIKQWFLRPAYPVFVTAASITLTVLVLIRTIYLPGPRYCTLTFCPSLDPNGGMDNISFLTVSLVFLSLTLIVAMPLLLIPASSLDYARFFRVCFLVVVLLVVHAGLLAIFSVVHSTRVLPSSTVSPYAVTVNVSGIPYAQSQIQGNVFHGSLQLSITNVSSLLDPLVAPFFAEDVGYVMRIWKVPGSADYPWKFNPQLCVIVASDLPADLSSSHSPFSVEKTDSVLQTMSQTRGMGSTGSSRIRLSGAPTPTVRVGSVSFSVLRSVTLIDGWKDGQWYMVMLDDVDSLTESGRTTYTQIKSPIVTRFGMSLTDDGQTAVDRRIFLHCRFSISSLACLP